MKIRSYLSLSLCISLLYACNSHPDAATSQTDKDIVPVRLLELQQEQNRNTMAVSGQFTTDDEVMLSFKTAGIISTLSVKEGDPVKKGQLLATLNPVEVNAQLQQARLAVEKTKRDYQRLQNLYTDSVATLEQLQNSKTAMQQAQQQFNIADFNRQYAEVRAPKDGYILRKMANAGQQIAAGTPILQTNGAASGKWMLRVNVSDQEWSAISINDPASIETTAVPGRPLSGIVSRKAEGVDPVTGTFSIDITLTGKKPSAIASGMFGKAVIQPSSPHSTAGNWQIPYEALLDGDGATGYVFVTNDRKTARKVKVTIAGIDKNTVRISGGLAGVTSVIISGSAYLTDNSPITIQSPVNAAK